MSNAHKHLFSAKRQWFYLVLLLSATFVACAARITIDLDREQTVIDVPAVVSESSEQDGLAVFELGADQFISTQTGRPAVPYQNLHLLLPPNAKPATAIAVLQAEYSVVEGIRQVAPVPPTGTRDPDGNEVIVWPADRTIVDGFDVDVYGTDDFWPAAQADIVGTGKLRRWNMAEIAVPLFRFNPVTGQLLRLEEAYVSVTAQKDHAAKEKPAKREHRNINERAERLAVNFRAAAAAYEDTGTQSQVWAADGDEAAPSPTLTDTGYVIVTTNAIRSASSKLTSFVAHKQARGFTVNVITETQYGSGSGDTAANNIRAWLQANYNNTAYGSGGILYVLLIGDPRTTSSSVPMKMCIGDHPTDYYYAELTSNWDSDGDGIYGEEEDTTEKYFDVYIGRISYYGTISETDAILQKIMNYENASSTQWRRKALLPMVPLDDSTPAYHLGEQIKNNLLEPGAIPSTRIYENTYGANPPPEFLLSQRYPATEWGQGIYGMVIWLTHGWDQGAAGIISTGEVSGLNNNYPSAVFQGSCMNGQPETVTNLGYSILKNGGIGTVAASRNGWYWVGESNFTNSSSVGGMSYQYARRLVERKTIGQAIWDSKEALGYWQKNYFVYNLYGDPSVTVMPAAPGFTVSPTHGFHFNMNYGATISGSSNYTLKNNGSSAIGWTAQGDVDWLTLSPVQGTINASGTAALSVQVTSQAASMPVGTHTGQITILNTTTGQAENRTIVLHIFPKALRGCWRLDETNGGTAYDATFSHKDGSLKGDFTFDAGGTAGVFGGALTFDGVDDYIEIPALDLYSNTVTLSAWVKRNGAQVNYSGIIMTRAGSSVAGLNVASNGELRYHWNDMSASYSWPSGLITPNGQWVFVALVIQPSSATMYMYDGVLRSSSQNVAHAIEEFNGITRIGHDPHESTRHFKGVIDEVRVYSRALTPAQINTLILGGTADAPQPYDRAVNVLRVTKLQWTMGASAVTNDIYFGTDQAAVSNATAASAEYKGRQTQNTCSLPALKRDTEYFWRIDQVDALGGVIRGDVWRFTTGDGRGAITRQVWTGLSGVNELTGLTGSPNYPNNPSLETQLNLFQIPTDWSDNYGTRVHGFFVPPVAGSYRFWISGDNEVELWLSTDAEPSRATRIAYIHGTWSNPQSFDQFSSQQSALFTLQANQPYYIRALHKEASGGDHMAVAFSGPGIARQIIPGEYLMPYAADYDWGAGPWGGQIRTIPGRIKAEEFDTGGEGVSYHDTMAGNSGNTFRTNEDVDIIAISGGYCITQIADGEWLGYTVNSSAVTTDLYARVASATAGGQIRVLLADQLLAVLDVPNTGSLTTWQTISVNNLTIPEGLEQVLRLEMVNGGFNLQWIDFVDRRPYLGTPFALPGTINFHDYDIGGQYISYYDLDNGNNYGAYRTDDVELMNDTAGGYCVYMIMNEWMEYTCNIQPGFYTITVYSAGTNVVNNFTVSIDGSPLASFNLPAVGNWFTWRATTVSNVYIAGGSERVLRFAMPGSATLKRVEFIRQYNAADINRDTFVDLEDLSVFSAQWLGAAGLPSADIAPPVDGFVDTSDLMVLIDNWLVNY